LRRILWVWRAVLETYGNAMSRKAVHTMHRASQKVSFKQNFQAVSMCRMQAIAEGLRVSCALRVVQYWRLSQLVEVVKNTKQKLLICRVKSAMDKCRRYLANTIGRSVGVWRWKAGVGAQLVEDRKNALKDLEHMLRTKAITHIACRFLLQGMKSQSDKDRLVTKSRKKALAMISQALLRQMKTKAVISVRTWRLIFEDWRKSQIAAKVRDTQFQLNQLMETKVRK